MKQEDLIRKKYGSENPFKVPEGYFEQFTANLMNALPEKQTEHVLIPQNRPRRMQTRIIRYMAAASVCGIMLAGTFYLKSAQQQSQHAVAVSEQTANDVELEDIYIEDILDYAMVSNQDIALYLTEAN